MPKKSSRIRNVFTVPTGGSTAASRARKALTLPAPLTPRTFGTDLDASGRYPSRTAVPTEYVLPADRSAFALARSAEAAAGSTSVTDSAASAATPHRLFLMHTPYVDRTFVGPLGGRPDSTGP